MNTRVARAEPGPGDRLPLRRGRLLRTSSHLALWTIVAVAGSTWSAPPMSAQALRVTSSTSFLQVAGGRRLGTVRPGTTLDPTGRTSGSWSEVVLEGWIWTGSVARTSRDGFDLSVSVAGGENFRDAPSTQGTIKARLLQGFLLERLGESGRWTHARRTGWVSTSALAAVDDAEPARPGPSASRGAGPAAASPEAPGAEEERLRVGGAPARLYLSPEGDTVGVVRPGADLAVLAREGAWVRVRLNGWVRAADLLPADSTTHRSTVSAADLKSNPDEYRGLQVRWSVQFVSLETAEAVRTDFYEGEPFILARAPDPSDGFVYLAVPPELLSIVEELPPLEMIEILARVRTGRSAIMGAPVLDLLAFY